MIWTREHDRILAERCEGLGVEPWSDVMAREEAVNWMTHPDDYCFFDRQFKCYRAVDAYNTDIAACIRAAEAWVFGGDPNPVRHWTVQRVGKHEIWAVCEWCDEITQLWIKKRTGAPTPEAALAEALYEAVKDTELEK